ncbi:rheb small monomeric GTPase RhbA [Coprinopsis cinerea okayama7|uniref:Rheb small monomeric GTPase RhbA n=1 Tax=Coprinopsis cinerea (strain Okayama-7 / 130 / ATCC MYA-4618 / FGSC 9003) TaxID=240176 RepID=A8NXD0_COPC7|nr:rheb small monomeric GTPase RhbA [Coprinopsis cinerea okayama7\|eukprot:XP_001837133.1 rheb small monomeric GTPase RhbA [Coprinopsis cinerea okayama7\
MASADKFRRRKIAVLGSRSVGKSSLVLQFIDSHFVESYYPTIENTFSKKVCHQGVEFQCDIIDTAGQDEFSILSGKHAIGIHGFVLVYSITSRASFDMIQIIYDKVTDFCGVKQIPCVIVGSKCDLKNNRVIDEKEGQELARSCNAAWIETSAKLDINVGKVFELCLSEIENKSAARNSNNSTQHTSSKSCNIM